MTVRFPDRLGRVPSALLAGVALLLAGAAAAAAVGSFDWTATQPRPFLHADHTALSCQECHGAGAQHAVPRNWTQRDCAACHHDPRRNLACAQCHERIDPPSGEVAVPVLFTVWAEARVRSLPFDHDRHTTAACSDCHLDLTTAPQRVACGSCHVQHHRVEANCSLCHRPIEADVHDMNAHLSCTGSGCHARTDRPAQPAMTRPFCLVCHQEQRDHQPGGLCHVCHQVREPEGMIP